jgi:hypothetical protein
MNHAASLSDTGTSVGLDFEFSMFLEKHGRVTPLTRGQIEQTPVGPLPHGIHEYRCRCCSLDHNGSPRLTEPFCAEMKLTQQELIAHLHSELHKRKSADGRLEKYIDQNNRNAEAHYARTASAPTLEALRKAMANAPQL